MQRTPIWILPAVIVVLACGGGWWLWKSQNKPPIPLVPVEAVLPAEFAAALKGTPAGKPVEKPAVVREVAQYSGNGRERLRVTVNNKDAKPYPVSIAAGTLFDSSRSHVVLLAPLKLDVAAGANKQADLNSAAISITNEIGEAAFTKSPATNSRIAPLISLLEKRTDVPFKVAQTAVLALADNAPADVFVKFKRLNSDLPVRFDPIAFKVENSEIMAALSLLHEAGGADSNLSLATDPQVKIESLLDNGSHDLALHYYGVTPEMQWSFWKYQLLAGVPSLRHYALYGISRYYPDVALVMMPRWAREKRLDSIFRLSAIRSLALTQRPEAIPLLNQLQQDLASELDLAQAAERASQYLASHPKSQ
jgi:hypothetical protein